MWTDDIISSNVYDFSSFVKQFGFSSKQSGFLMSCDEIGFLTTTIFVGYIAPRLHIPHALSAATMFYEVSALLCCLPYALTRLQNNIEILHWLQGTVLRRLNS